MGEPTDAGSFQPVHVGRSAYPVHKTFKKVLVIRILPFEGSQVSIKFMAAMLEIDDELRRGGSCRSVSGIDRFLGQDPPEGNDVLIRCRSSFGNVDICI